MQADIFYAQPSSNTTQLILLSTTAVFDNLHAVDKDALCAHHFKGQWGEVVCVAREGDVTAYIGAGSGDDDARAVASACLKLPAGSYTTRDDLSEHAMLVWSLAQYRFDRYKKAHHQQPRILCLAPHFLSEALEKARAIFLVRDLINTPTNDLGPAELAAEVSALAQLHHAEWKECVGEDLLYENFPAIYAVGKASEEKPRLLSLLWGNEEHPRVTLVGKGVCFDSGGLDLKTSSSMRLMKKDMGGAAQVLGLAQWIMANKLPIRLEVLIPAVENAVGPRAYRPGDVLTMRNGLTVEIDNTDAEGRLILADALTYACEREPDLLFDFSTLTGAARVAVGTEISAAFSDHDALVTSVIASGEKMHDPVWRMPLYAGYARLLESSIADLINSTPSPYAGAITAALFLQRFVTPHVPWLHFDIMAWNVSHKPGKPEGGEAMGMLAVADYLRQRYGVL